MTPQAHRTHFWFALVPPEAWGNLNHSLGPNRFVGPKPQSELGGSLQGVAGCKFPPKRGFGGLAPNVFKGETLRARSPP